MAAAVLQGSGNNAHFASLSSADGILALLNEPDDRLKVSALRSLNEIVDQHWMEIASFIPQIEALYEQESFKERELAAIVASKVFYHLESLEDAVKYALGAGDKFDVSSKTEYVETLIAKCIDEYIALRVAHSESKSSEEVKNEGIDPRLENIVERMFERCYSDGEFKQALGIAVEARRLDKIRQSIETSSDVSQLLSYCLNVCLNQLANRDFRHQVLQVLVDIYQTQPSPDYISICQCLLFLDDAASVASTLDGLLKKDQESTLNAYQAAFELSENENQPFLLRVVQALPPVPKPSADQSLEAKGDEVYNGRLKKLVDILSGEISCDLYLQFLYSHNKTDLLLLKNIKDKLEARNSVTNSSAVMAHAIMQCGTTVDTFLRENLEWLGRASNWAKFTATASIGVIHKGHRKESMKLLGSYLPQIGSQGSSYQEGGALYALGLIHANHGGEQLEYLMEALRNARDEIIQHGACLGLGLSAMATGRDDLYEHLMKGVLYHDNAVAGEAAGLAMGLIMLGMGKSKPIQEMLQYAQDTKHEKIIRGIAIGIALSMYAREEQADTLIEQLLRDKDPILRYGGVYTVAMAYVGTANNKAIRRLLHLAVSDVSDDVRRAAVTAIGFVLCNAHQQVPRIVSLLSESFNPHVRYGAALAVGISCAGTGLPDALNLLFPLTKDRVDYVRQGALIALAMVLIQHNTYQEPRVGELRKIITDTVENKHGDTMTKLGAILAAGILDAGGRNVTIALRSPSGHKKMASIVGMALFLQFWYWYPLTHFISLSFTPTAVIGLNKDLQMPKNFAFVSNAKPSIFAYPPPTEIKKEVKTKKLPTATLSVTAKAKAKAKKKEEEKKAEAGMDVEVDAMDVDSKEAKKEEVEEKPMTEEEKKAAEEKAAAEKLAAEPPSEVLQNPARVTWAQQKVLSFESEQRYVPIKKQLAGIVMLRDSHPEEAEELVSQVTPKSFGPDEEEEASPPEPFEFLR